MDTTEPPAGHGQGTRGDVAAGMASLVVLGSLFFVKFDLETSVLWVGGSVAGVLAVRRALRLAGAPNTRVALGLALAAVVAWQLSCANCGRALSSASATTRSLARTAQQRCNADGRCPTVETLCPDALAGARTCINAGSAGLRFPVAYRVADDGKTFSTGFRQDIDNSYGMRGGVGVALEEVSTSEGVETVNVVEAAP